MPKAQPIPTLPRQPKDKYAANRTLIYISPVLREALTVLGADNKARRKKGGNVSALITHLGKRYAMQPASILALRRAGFKQLDELLSL